MNDWEFKELLKLAVEKLKDEMVSELLEHDSVYQEDSQKLSKVELQYMHLDLTETQREICNDYFKYKDRTDFEYGTHAYMAGLVDGFRIMSALFPEKWKAEKEELLNAMAMDNAGDKSLNQ